MTNQDSALILIVDDDNVTRIYLRELLEYAGYRVLEACDGCEAIAAYIYLHPNMVLLDAIMPVMDGFTCCSQLQTLPDVQDIPILMMTDAYEPASVERAFAVGAIDYITKPIQWPVLSHRIRYLLAASCAMQQLRQQPEQAQLQEAQIKIALEAARMGTWDWDIIANQVTWSDNKENLFGLEKGTFDGKYETFLSCIHPQDRDFVNSSVMQAVQTGTEYDVEFRILLPDGSIRWLVSKGVVFRNASGEPVRMPGIVMDITKRKQAEEALEVHAHQQALVAELSQMALAGTNLTTLLNSSVMLVAQCLKVEYCKVLELLPDGQVLLLRAGVGWQSGLVGRATMSAGINSQAGYTLVCEEPVIVDDLRTETRFSAPKFLLDHQVVSGISITIAAKKQPFGILGVHTTKQRTFTKDDVYFLQAVANLLATAIERQRGQAELHWQNLRSQLFADITLKIRQSLQIDEILQTSVTEVQKLLCADRVLVLRLRSNGAFITLKEAVVPGLLVALGLQMSEPAFGEICLQQYRQGQISAMSNVEQDQAKIPPSHLELLRKFEIQANLCVPIFLQNQLWGLLVAHQCTHPRQWNQWEIELLQQLADQIGIALTQGKILEAETRQRQELSRSNEELQQFAFIASHDLQEPLRKIKTFSERLMNTCGDSLSEPAQDYLERMQKAVVRMQTLIEDLLTLSRLTTRAQPFVSVNLAQITQEVLSDLEVRIHQTGATIEVGDLPIIKADPLQMRQLMQNLIGNALKFHRPQVPPIVKIYGQYLNNQSEQIAMNCELGQIIVEDNGIGFEQKYSDRIFNIFQRLHSRREYEGTGIGLTICRKIVERHYGKITAQSNPGQGTKFMVILPINSST
jgi:PAS domain S-box-containing protein